MKEAKKLWTRTRKVQDKVGQRENRDGRATKDLVIGGALRQARQGHEDKGVSCPGQGHCGWLRSLKEKLEIGTPRIKACG